MAMRRWRVRGRKGASLGPVSCVRRLTQSLKFICLIHILFLVFVFLEPGTRVLSKIFNPGTRALSQIISSGTCTLHIIMQVVRSKAEPGFQRFAKIRDGFDSIRRLLKRPCLLWPRSPATNEEHLHRSSPPPAGSWRRLQRLGRQVCGTAQPDGLPRSVTFIHTGGVLLESVPHRST